MAGTNNPVPFGSPEGSAHWTRAQTEAGGALTPLRALPAICDTDGFDIGLIWPKRKLRVLVACEYSATVRDAFRARGFDAWSCDLLPTEGDWRWHIRGNVFGSQVTHLAEEMDTPPINRGWDLLIAHPPCTDLAVSGARHFAAKIADGRQARALEFVQCLLDAPIPHIALENPISIISSRIRKPDQIIQPWQFGHGETKATCLWLKGLPKLTPTNIVEGRSDRIHKMPPGPNRWKERSRTYQGIAEAMADQWGSFLQSIENAGANPADGFAAPASDRSFHDSEVA